MRPFIVVISNQCENTVMYSPVNYENTISDADQSVMTEV